MRTATVTEAAERSVALTPFAIVIVVGIVLAAELVLVGVWLLIRARSRRRAKLPEPGPGGEPAPEARRPGDGDPRRTPGGTSSLAAPDRRPPPRDHLSDRERLALKQAGDRYVDEHELHDMPRELVDMHPEAAFLRLRELLGPNPEASGDRPGLDQRDRGS